MGTLNNMMTNDDIVTVEWPNFGQALGYDVWQFYMANEYSDVSIRTEEGYEIPSHRIILAICSPYFRDLFKTNRTASPIGKWYFMRTIQIIQNEVMLKQRNAIFSNAKLFVLDF